MESLIFHIRSFYSNLKCSCMLFWIWGDVVFAEKQLPEASYEKGFRRNFVKFTGKHLWQSLFFNKVAGLMLVTLVKKRLWHKCFPVNFEKFLKITFFVEHLRWLDLKLFFKISVVGQSRKSHWCGLGLQIRNLKYLRG